MPDDLSSIEGLADKHRRVLARHHVTDLRGLVQADRRVIHRAMANLRPRPTLELISHWQDEARSMLDEIVTDTSQWHTAASFVVIFSQRQREDNWERRAEVEAPAPMPMPPPGPAAARPQLHIDSAGPRGSHRQRSPARNAPASRDPHPAPERPRLEPP